ncbi:MAG: hypothetical protein LBK68_04920 [Candidatus Margulisbacteria bacterium]|jgi:hypothetical protein|nr:hypothetical protein [Candidatus Margulisiibacteriota bacterium]
MTIATGQSMLASDILDLTFFPKGTILTFSTTAWSATSAEFKTIWKICNTANHAEDVAIPDLTDKFLRGADSSGAEGGADSRSIILQTTNLPSHSHEATGLSLSGLSLSNLKASSNGAHEHILSGKTVSAGTHTHGITDPGHKHTISSFNQSIESGSKDYRTYHMVGQSRDTSSDKTGISINNDGAHEHGFSSDSKAFMGGAHEHDVSGSITGGSINGSTATSGSGTAFNVNTVPTYYTVIYIIKVA